MGVVHGYLLGNALSGDAERLQLDLVPDFCLVDEASVDVEELAQFVRLAGARRHHGPSPREKVEPDDTVETTSRHAYVVSEKATVNNLDGPGPE